MAAGYPFVGRGDVLGELRDALGRATAGRGGLVTLTGAAGAGKTRTAEEAAARSAGFRTLWTWCPPGTAGRAFRPWSRLLRELTADDARCGRLVAASPPLRALLSGTATGGRPPGGEADPETSRLRLTGDVAELLTTAARRHPLLLVLDDLHARLSLAAALAELFVCFIETDTAPDGLFSDDVFLDLTLPQWRVQTSGRDELVALRRRSHPPLGTVPRHRADLTDTGLVLEWEERWEDEQGSWCCRELMRAEVRDGAIDEISVYCTGDWDAALRASHAREVTLLRP